MKVGTVFVVSVMNQQTGIYNNFLVSSNDRWIKDSNAISDNWLIQIDVFDLGAMKKATYFSIEEFEENELNV